MAPSAGSSPSSLPPALAASLYLHLDSCVLTLPLFHLLLIQTVLIPPPHPPFSLTPPSPPQACHLRLPSYSSIWLYLSVIQPTKRGKTGREGFWFTDISLLVLRLEAGEEGGRGRWRVLGKTRNGEDRTEGPKGIAERRLCNWESLIHRGLQVSGRKGGHCTDQTLPYRPPFLPPPCP